jgi:uncharacterized protein YjbI with pentapeptide repeats
MANPEHFRLVLAAGEKLQLWRRHHVNERLDLSGADLSGADLSGACAYRAKFREADLSAANLS